ncbi:MAG: cupredoxin domain-containing protein [Actinomycetota bacterium]
MRRSLLLASVVVAAPLLAACGGSDTGGGSLAVTAADFRFEPAELTVHPGTETTLELTNEGEVEHSFTSDELGVDIEAEAGESATATFTSPDEDATVEFHCRYHPDQMRGTVVVGAGGGDTGGGATPGDGAPAGEEDLDY